MKKFTAVLLALLMAFGALAVSSAPAGAVPTCETRIAGFMTLDFADGADGNGTGVARWDGHWIRVNIDSTAITVPGSGICQADLTGDGSLDFFDVSAFLNAFNAQDSIADFTGDGSFDFFDVSAFLNAFNAGCP